MHGMTSYFVRRLLLIPLTFVITTGLAYTVIRSVPGGPIEQIEREMSAAAQGEAGGGMGDVTDTGGLDEDAREELERYYNLDRAIPVGYLQWLGVWPKDKRTAVSLEEREAAPEFWALAEEFKSKRRDSREAFEKALRDKDRIFRDGLFYAPISAEGLAADKAFFSEAARLRELGSRRAQKQLDEHLKTREYRIDGERYYEPATPESASSLDGLRKANDEANSTLETHLAAKSYVISARDRFYYQEFRFSGVLQGDLGRSSTANKPALDVIISKLPISMYFGIIGYLATWFVCVPLGIMKALRHRTMFDTASSIVVFLGYSTPPFAACLVLLVLFGGGSYWDWVPLGGFRDPDWDKWWSEGLYMKCMLDQLHHTAVPIFGYLIVSFASMTVLMKNSLMENLGADYVRTAFAKGVPERRVIYLHTLRNSMIPMTATVGHALGILFAGSFLIEKTCNIPGMGLLGFDALLSRDFPIVLGILMIGVLIRLFGNIFSDLVWAMIDPRIRFR